MNDAAVLVSLWENDRGDKAELLRYAGESPYCYLTEYSGGPPCTAMYLHEHLTALRHKGFHKVA